MSDFCININTYYMNRNETRGPGDKFCFNCRAAMIGLLNN